MELSTDKPILVTGGTGYIAGWIVKILLTKGYTVHTTVRDKAKREKYAHLAELAQDSNGILEIFEADLLHEGSFAEAMADCQTVIHTASPFVIQGIKNPEKQLITPALKGTQNVLNAVNQTESVKRVVLTSSVVAIYGDNADSLEAPGQVLTEAQWNSSSSAGHQPYPYSKTLAEKEAWKMQKEQNRWDLLTINPGFVFGPSLSKRKDSTSIKFMLDMVDGTYKSGVPDLMFGVVDVRDVALAHVHAAKLEQASGRHILVGHHASFLDMANMLSEKYGDKYDFPKRKLPKFMFYLVGPFMGFSWKYVSRNIGIPLKFDNNYSQKDLQLEYTPLGKTLTDHLEQLAADGLISKN